MSVRRQQTVEQSECYKKETVAESDAGNMDAPVPPPAKWQVGE